MTSDLSSLTWLRLRATLVCVRAIPHAKALPVEVFQAMVKAVTSRLDHFPTGRDGEGKGICFHLAGRRFNRPFSLGEKAVLEIFFCGESGRHAESWRTAFVDYLADPATERNYELTDLQALEVRNLAAISKSLPNLPEQGEICLEFLSPLPFQPEKGKNRWYVSTNKFTQLLAGRIKKLFDVPATYRSDNDDLLLLPYYWNYTEHKRHPLSQPDGKQYINGCIGKLYLKGHFSDLLPYLLLGSELHAGTGITYGMGYYLLHPRSLPHLTTFFPRRAGVLTTIRDVLERYDNAAESLALTEKFPFSDTEFAESLCKELLDNIYEPSPATAFAIPKKDGSSRIIEQLKFRDLIVQQHILKTIDVFIDRFFEEGSIGFRKGMSRHKAVDMVKDAITAGYRFVVESDVEDFFPSVDLHVLSELLDRYLPSQDSLICKLIMKCAKTGHILEGKYIDRVKGLAQGAPLSPILANLFLDSFDERVSSWNVRMIRFSDDFIILTKTMEDAEGVLLRAEEYLGGLGLKINKDKTSIKKISDGFQFLGIRFEGYEIRDLTGGEEGQQLKKPLYITEPYVFLSLNGDAIDIIKQKKVIESIPVRRLSEIIVLEKASFSTALVRRCTGGNIPLTLTLNSGYYVTTIRPDSKKYYGIVAEHSRKHYLLSDTERLWVAKEFAARKLENYISLCKQRYTPGMNMFIHSLERTVDNIHQAADVKQVLGYEGSTAKKIYQELNSFITKPAFHLKKRDRNIADPINTLLNFCYYLLFTRINATLRSSGLDPYLGFLHSPHDNYESLACDIEELFRARIDRFVIRLINDSFVNETDFTPSTRPGEKKLRIGKEAMRKIIHEYELEMERKNSKNELSMSESIYVQIQTFKKYILDDATLSLYRWNV